MNTDFNKIMLEGFFCKNLLIDNEIDAKRLLDIIDTTDIKDIWGIIKDSKYKVEITTKNIPQLSNPEDVDKVISIFINSGLVGMTYKRLGYYLDGKNKSDGARSKYGENHYKLAMQLGLTLDDKVTNVTCLGTEYIKIESKEKRREIRNKLVLRIPIIQHLLSLSEGEIVNARDVLSEYLNGTTICRRKSSVKKLIEEFSNYCDKDLFVSIKNIIWK